MPLGDFVVQRDRSVDIVLPLSLDVEPQLFRGLDEFSNPYHPGHLDWSKEASTLSGCSSRGEGHYNF